MSKTENILKIVSFGAGVAFSGIMLVFSIVQSVREPNNVVWVSLAMTITGLFLPSPMQLMNGIKQVVQPTPQPVQVVPAWNGGITSV